MWLFNALVVDREGEGKDERKGIRQLLWNQRKDIGKGGCRWDREEYQLLAYLRYGKDSNGDTTRSHEQVLPLTESTAETDLLLTFDVDNLLGGDQLPVLNYG